MAIYVKFHTGVMFLLNSMIVSNLHEFKLERTETVSLSTFYFGAHRWKLLRPFVFWNAPHLHFY